MYTDLNEIQIKIFSYIQEHVGLSGYPPSIREIMKATNLKSTSTVHKHIGVLEDNGYIRKDPSKPRALEILKSEEYRDRTLNIPLVGSVTAGAPILATENIDDTFTVSDKIIAEDDFILRVEGDSMIEAGIYHRDYVVVKKQTTAQNGDIVIALIDDSATIKRFFKEEDVFRLQPENQAMDPIYVRDLAILGKVKGVYRKI